MPHDTVPGVVGANDGIGSSGGGAGIGTFKPGGGAIGSLIGFVPDGVGIGRFGAAALRLGNPPLAATLGA